MYITIIPILQQYCFVHFPNLQLRSMISKYLVIILESKYFEHTFINQYHIYTKHKIITLTL